MGTKVSLFIRKTKSLLRRPIWQTPTCVSWARSTSQGHAQGQRGLKDCWARHMELSAQNQCLVDLSVSSPFPNSRLTVFQRAHIHGPRLCANAKAVIKGESVKVVRTD